MAGLYIHIPFCHSKCAYCDFYSMPRTELMSEYIDSVIREYGMRASEISEPFSTVYIGGGTPSLMPLALLEKLLSALPLSDVREFTIEANPEDINREFIEGISRLGVNRVSIGVQSFNDDELNAVGRTHDASTAVKALNLLLDSGIKEITADLIYGLPGQTVESWKRSLGTMLDFGLPHLSAYSLSYEPGTKLYSRLVAGKIEETPDDVYEKMYDILVEQTSVAGYEHYEISNFAIPGHRAIHNSSYWNFTPYLGLGVASHSFDGSVRRENPRNLNNYLKAVASGVTYFAVEDETEESLHNDYVITRLRTSEGIDYRDMELRFGSDAVLRLKRIVSPMIKSGRIIESGNSIRIEEKAILISDSILRELIVI